MKQSRLANFASSARVELGLLCILLLLCIVFSLMKPEFMAVRNLLNITRQVSVVLIVGIGMLSVVLAGEIDLSVGSSTALCGVAAAYVMQRTGMVHLGIGSALLCGLVVGAANGLFVVYGHIPSFIVTLATMGILRGCSYVWTNGRPMSNLPVEYEIWGAGYVGGVPVSSLVAVFFFAVGLFMMHYTKHGVYVKSIGANVEAARFSTIPIRPYKLSVFVVSGLMCALGGIITSSKLLSAQPTANEGLEMDVLSAVILGGASLSGGVGTAMGLFIGALTIGVINNGMNMIGVTPYFQQIVKGCIILAAVLAKRKVEN